MSSNHRPGPRGTRRNISQQANARGVFAVRRKVAPESYGALQHLANDLQNELSNAGRMFDSRNLGVTVVGFSRYSRHHLGKGPRTAIVTEQIGSAHLQIEVNLGRLAVFGSDSKAKLGIDLESDALLREEQEYSDKFTREGFPLKSEPNGDGTFRPHLSIALLYNDYLGHFQDPRVLKRLSDTTGLGKAEGSIILDSVITKQR